MSTIDMRARILEHFVHSSADDAGRHDTQRASELDADDVVLEWPQECCTTDGTAIWSRW